MKLPDFTASRDLDRIAAADWGLDPFALVEAAGRACARVLRDARPELFVRPGLQALGLIGAGNNGADALVLLRALIFEGRLKSARTALVVTKADPPGVRTPRSEALKALRGLGVAVYAAHQDLAAAARALAGADLIIDGIAGTGLDAALRGTAADLVAAVQRACSRGADDDDRPPPLLVAVDLPSGLFGGWRPGLPVLRADLTLAIEPRKEVLYRPAARPLAGTILPVTGIFPPELLAAATGPELADLAGAAARLPRVAPEAYKYRRGVVEIRAGSVGATGAAQLAARGAQAGGAGLIRLVVDPEIQPLLAVGAGGIMVAVERGRFEPDAILLGPGWAWNAARAAVLAEAREKNAAGTGLVLDADAIRPAADFRFSGDCILTPHPGEFVDFLNRLRRGLGRQEVGKDEVAADPLPHLRAAAAACGAVVLLKGHVLHVAAPDGRTAVVDGMTAALASGGSGDVLAGLCAALLARGVRAAPRTDGFDCAVAAAALLVQAGREAAAAGGFVDPSAVADAAARIAGGIWL